MSDFPIETPAPAIPEAAPAPVPVATPEPVPAPAVVTAPAAAPVPTPPLVTISSSATKAILLSVATGAVRAAGVFLMAHGAMTQAQADAITPIVAQEIAGTALLVGGQCWASLREWLSHQKIFAAAFADPSTIIVK